MPVILRNNVAGTLASAVSASDVGLVLSAGHGARFPAPNAGEYFYATLVGVDGSVEITRVTARVGDVLQVERGVDGSTRASFAAGSRVEMRITAASIQDLITDGLAVTPVYPGFAGNAGLFLRVVLAETGVEWAGVTAADVLPDVSGNPGRALFVNGSGDGVIWADLPTYGTMANEDLVVSALGDDHFMTYDLANLQWSNLSPAGARQVLGLDARVFGTGIEAPSTNSEVLLRFVSDVSGALSANLNDWRIAPDGVATGSDYVMVLQRNGVSVGSITIDTAGVVTTATLGSLPVVIAPGDVVRLLAPANAAVVGGALSFAITGKVVF